MATSFLPYAPGPELPEDVLRIIFRALRQRVRLTGMTPQSFPNREDAWFSVGPPTSIMKVSRLWHRLAISDALLWSSIVVVLENERTLDIGNPGSVLHHLRYCSGVLLTLVIASRPHLSGSGVNAESPMHQLNMDFLSEVAPRIQELVLSFDLCNALYEELFSPHLQFPLLEKLTLRGIASPVSGLSQAGFWRSPALRRLAWATTTISSIPILSPAWLKLVELTIADEWTLAIHSGVIRYFLSEAKLLARLQCRICEFNSVNEQSNHVPLAFRQPPFPPLRHAHLKALTITFHGQARSDDGVPAILCEFEAPQLRTLEYQTDWSTNFDPESVLKWGGTGASCALTHLICNVWLIDMTSLVEGIRAMPFLEVLRCIGGVVGHFDDSGRLTSLLRNPAFNPYADDRFLRNIAGPEAFDAALGTSFPGQSVSAAAAPCPFLYHLDVRNGCFTTGGIEAFVQARLYPGPPAPSLPHSSRRSKVFRMFTIGDLVVPGMRDVYGSRRSIRDIEGTHRVKVSVRNYVSLDGFTLAGPGYNPDAWYFQEDI